MDVSARDSFICRDDAAEIVDKKSLQMEGGD
jgi:hypothetical protein